MLFPNIFSHCTDFMMALWNEPHRDLWMSMVIHTSKAALPESVCFEGWIGVDVVMQPPLHRHVPVTHAMTDLHTEVSVVAVNILDGFEVVFLFSSGIRTREQSAVNTKIWTPKTPWYLVSNYWCILLYYSLKPYVDVPVVDSGSSSGFGQRLFWVTAQTCADTASLSSTPRCIKTHPKHEEHCDHVEKPGDREKDRERMILKVCYLFPPYHKRAGILLKELNLNNYWASAVFNLLWLHGKHL